MQYNNQQNHSCHRKRGKNLGVPELIAIALGGMVGGGIFTILGISVSLIGAYTPVAIAIGAMVAALAASIPMSSWAFIKGTKALPIRSEKRPFPTLHSPHR